MPKTGTVLIGSHQCISHQHMTVTIAGNHLCCVTVAKHQYLGLYIDQNLTWQQHNDRIVSKAV